MKLDQECMLLQLASLLNTIAKECHKDPEFNSNIGELEIFNKSIDEASNDIINLVENKK